MFAAIDSLRALAKALILPPTSLFLVIGLCAIAARIAGTRRPALRRISKLGAAASALALASLSVPFVAHALVDSLQTSAPIRPDATFIDASAIVVLSADVDCDPAEYGPDQPGALSLVRCRYGAALAKRTGLPLLVCGGVLRPDRRPVSHVLRDFIEDELGVPVEWTEDLSVNTRGNAVGSAAVLTPVGIKRIALVTHAWHMPRAIESFERAGFEVVPAPTAALSPPATISEGLMPRMKSFRDSSWAIHEWIGRLWYQLT